MSEPSIEKDALLREVRDRLVRAVDPERIIAFGSRARGDADSESDLDLIVVMETDLSPGERAAKVRRALRGLGVPLDVLVYRPEKYEHYRKLPWSVVAIAEEEGVVLHG